MPYVPNRLVFFDLETTGLSPKRDEIVQLAARFGNRSFSAYIHPTVRIHPKASAVNGLTIAEDYYGNEVLLKDGDVVETEPIEEVLFDFLQWSNTNVPFGRKILVGHFCRNLDIPMLRKAMIQENYMEELMDIYDGYIDTLPVLRDVYPELYPHGQKFVYESLFGETYEAHDAENDARALQRIIIELKLNQDALRFEQPF